MCFIIVGDYNDDSVVVAGGMLLNYKLGHKELIVKMWVNK